MQLEVGDHVVQFYDRDPELTEAIVGYVAAALEGQEIAIVLASDEHVAQFEAALGSAGVDVASARDEGLLVVADAAETVARFMRDGQPDATKFEEVMGGLVSSARAGGRTVRVYGEMVAVLWEAGLVAAAVRLEELWNDLVQRTPFSLFCAYPADLVGGEEHIDSLVRVCHQHSSVVGAAGGIDKAVATFDCSPRAPGAARRFVTETLGAWGRTGLVDDAAVVVTELATNVVIHAQCGFDVRVTRHRDTVRVELADASHVVPALVEPVGNAMCGRGLVLVDALSRRWGHELLDDGKRVWAELGTT